MRRPLLLTLTVLLGLTACAVEDPATAEDAAEPVPVAQLAGDDLVERAGSWAPAPERILDLEVTASAGDGALTVRTQDGHRAFLPGVNLGATVPGHAPGELAVTAGDYRRWLDLARRLGARAVRVYTIHPPAFYDELARHNAAHTDDPLYLVQGVYFPDEEAWSAGRDLWAPDVRDAFLAEVADAHHAVTGRLERAPLPGRASGTWTVDVGSWVIGWIVGVELDPEAVVASDERNAAKPAWAGTYFRSTPDATPTERWLAEVLDHLATLEATDGRSSPLAFIGWPTTDPLRHPDEPLDQEDLAQVDANHVLPTAAWPGGALASYHAYPYYPDFLRHEEGLGTDPYAGYLAALRDHHADAGLPVLISELGVPSSHGSAHDGPLGRDQGGHTEREAMAIQAELVGIVRAQGLAGAMPFAFVDEWFKHTWNTMDLDRPGDRRPLWRDVLTNEQHFGLVAADAGLARSLRLGAAGETWDARTEAVHRSETGEVLVGVAHDEAFLHLQLRVPDADRVLVAFDVLPGGAGPLPGGSDVLPGADAAIVIDGATARLLRWAGVDATTVLHGAGSGWLDVDHRSLADGSGAWVPFRQIVNRPLTVPSTGVRHPVELHDVSMLRGGSGHDDHWHRGGGVVQLRVPWGMLGFSDPSSRRAVLPGADGSTSTVAVEQVGLAVVAGGAAWVTDGYTYEPWQQARWSERLKDGAELVAEALVAAAGRP